VAEAFRFMQTVSKMKSDRARQRIKVRAQDPTPAYHSGGPPYPVERLSVAYSSGYRRRASAWIAPIPYFWDLNSF
jgi:hypothetical protein